MKLWSLAALGRRPKECHQVSQLINSDDEPKIVVLSALSGHYERPGSNRWIIKQGERELPGSKLKLSGTMTLFYPAAYKFGVFRESKTMVGNILNLWYHLKFL